MTVTRATFVWACDVYNGNDNNDDNNVRGNDEKTTMTTTTTTVDAANKRSSVSVQARVCVHGIRNYGRN